MTVTVIGEYCTDTFIYCETNRLSPEAPVPVLNPVEVVTNSGMAGNVIENVKVLYPNTRVIGFHQKNEIKKTRYVDKKSNHMFIRIDENDVSDEFNLNQSKTNAILNSDVVIVSDYNKGFLSEEDLVRIGYHSKLSILDSKKILNKEIINSFSFVKMNEKEFDNNKHLPNKSNIITTLGSKGSLYQNEVFNSPSPKETIDVSGAGDTFTSAFILKYFETRDERESIIFANKMSSIVVSKRGVSTP
jgi:bifunctional ADP-heptose synthase (sugar kinase/adenylyltransferase)